MLTVDATVTDVDRATIRASSRPILVHPSAYYVGLRQTPRSNSELQVVVTDIDGNAGRRRTDRRHDRGRARLRERSRRREDHRHAALQADERRRRRCRARGSRAIPRARIRAIARIADARGRDNAAEYGSRGGTTEDRKRDLDIVPDQPSYRPGDVAKLQHPFGDRAGDRGRVVRAPGRDRAEARRADDRASTSVELPIEPSVHRERPRVVDRVAKRKAHDPTSPAAAARAQSTEVDLPVDVESARLVMTTRPLKAIVQPGEDATFEVEVRHDDKPVARRRGRADRRRRGDPRRCPDKTHADPLAPFYRHVDDGTTRAVDARPRATTPTTSSARRPGFSRFNLDDGRWTPAPARATATAPGGGATGHMSAAPSVTMGSGRAMVTARKDFRATAVFSPHAPHRRERQGAAHGQDARQPDAVSRSSRSRPRPRTTSARPRARSSRSARSTRARSRRAS